MNGLELQVGEGDVVRSGLCRSTSLIIGPAEHEMIIECVIRRPLQRLSERGVLVQYIDAETILVLQAVCNSKILDRTV